MTSVRVLGTFEVSVKGVPADLGGPRQRSVLARLVAARGTMVPADRLVEDLWPAAAPPRALAGIQSFVSHLRRALEPDRPPRTPASVLVTAPPGYALRLPAEAVDAWRFDALVSEAGERLDGAPRDARRRAAAALAEWRGPAYAEFAELPWAAAEAARLDERRRVAVERRAAAMLRLSAAAEAVPDLAAHASENPLREEAWRLLSLALYRAGRQGDALAALRRARTTLAEELGVDPGPALQRLEADIFAQSPDLDARPASAPIPAPGRRRGLAVVGGGLRSAAGELFVGRGVELGRLRAAASAAARGRCVPVLIGGDAGAGKSALAARAAHELARDGWTTAWGRVPETGGFPAAWPWAESLRELAAALPPGDAVAGPLAALLDDEALAAADPARQRREARGDLTVGRFRLHRAVGDYLTAVAAEAPLLLVLDDLHRADDETLALLAQLPERLRGRRVLLAGTFRSTEPAGGRLAEAFAALARHEPERIDLAGLSPAEVGVLVRDTCAGEVEDAVVAAIAERTGGNPFFARETAKLLQSEGTPAATSAVPAAVGDVLRRRIAKLPGAAQAVLRYAAVFGRDMDVDALIDVAADAGDLSEDDVIEAVEAGLVTGLVTEPAAGRLRFAHALVRDTLYGELSRLRRGRLHARVAAALERRRPDDIAGIAHHYLAAGTAPGKAVRYAGLAAQAAEARLAHAAAATLWARAADTARDTGTGTAREPLELDIAAIRAGALGGEVMPARRRYRAAIRAARELGDVELLARVIASFDVPTFWSARHYGTVEVDIVEAAEEALAGLAGLPDAADGGELRVRLLTTIAMELEGEQGERGNEASLEAVRIARRLGRPEPLAAALNGRYMNAYRTAAGLAERRRLGEELLALATEHDLGGYAVLAHLQIQAAAGGALDFAAAEEHMRRGRKLAEQYGMPLLALISQWYEGLRAVIAGDYEVAERHYTRVSEAIARTGVWGSELGMMFLAVFCVRLLQGRTAELIDQARWAWEEWRHVDASAEVYALALTAAGRPDEARQVVADAGPVRRDYFMDIALALRGRRAIGLGERTTAEQVYRELLPFHEQLAGGACAAFTIGPVAQTLGDLAAFLDRPDEAAEHYRRAAGIGDRAGAAHWREMAEEAIRALPRHGTPAA